MASMLLAFPLSLLCLSLTRTVEAQCNYIQQSSTSPLTSPNVCIKGGSSGYQIFRCENGVVQERYTDSWCTNFVSSGAYSPYSYSCDYTSGTCSYAHLCTGCCSASYAVPESTCTRDNSNYFKMTCSSATSMSMRYYFNSVCTSGGTLSIGIGGGCDTVNGETYQTIGCGSTPNGPTVAPTTAAPTTGAPTAPTTATPTSLPTEATSRPTGPPTGSPTPAPTRMPSPSPTRSPLDAGETHPPSRSPTVANEGDIYLGGGVNAAEGRVFIHHNGQWGSCCDDNTDKETEGVVICAQLGYAYVAAFNYNGDVTFDGTIWLDSVECEGTEETLSECAHADWGVTNCGHSEDLWIRCTNDPEENIVTDPRNTSSAKRIVSTGLVFLLGFFRMIL